MRTVVLAALGLLIVSPSMPAQEQPGTPTTWAAKLFADENGKIPPLGHDFGTVPRGAMLHHQFPIRNIYAVPLTITCDVSCTCVSVTPKKPQTIILQPKETGTIDITMDTMRFDGHKKQVFVYVQHPQYWSSTALDITAVRQDDVVLNPAQATFGAVPAGQQVAPRELVIRYTGRQPAWQITGAAQNETAPFDLRYQEQLPRRIGLVEYHVWLTPKADTQPGSYKDELKLATTDPYNPVVVVPYDLRVEAALSVLPDVVRLPPVKVGTPVERKVTVKAGRPFQILGVDGQGDGVTAQFAPLNGPTQYVTIKVDPTQPGAVQKTLTIRTNLGATATVKVEGTAMAP
jgi:hypothetical protein